MNKKNYPKLLILNCDLSSMFTYSPRERMFQVWNIITLRNNLSATLNNSEEVKTLLSFVSIYLKCHKPSESSQTAVWSLPKPDKFSHTEVLCRAHWFKIWNLIIYLGVKFMEPDTSSRIFGDCQGILGILYLAVLA